MNATAGTGAEGGGGWRNGCAAKGARWRPLELAAMIGGFIVFWPIGLTILGLKLWQKRSDAQGDLVGFAMGKFEEAKRDAADLFRGGWKAAPEGASGNRAFDEWREAELARIEKERHRLDEAVRDFNDYRDNLRKARDREEFDGFVRERDAKKAAGQTG